MKNRKREICTSGSVRDEAGQPPHLLGRRDNFCIWPRALPRCRPCRASRGRKPIRRGRCASSSAFRRRRDRHRRAPDRSMAVGAARPAIHRREPAGRRQQYRHRGGRACAAGRLHAPSGRRRRTRSTRRSTTSSISISSATSRRSRASAACRYVMVVNPSVPAKTVPEFIAYAKANPGKINMASAGNGTAATCRRRAVQDDDRRRHGPRALSRRGARADRSARRAGAGHVRRHAVVDRAHQGRQAARAGGDHRDALGGAAGHPDRGRFRAGLRGERLVSASARPRTRPPRSSTSSTRRSTRLLPIPR